jgi:hypothetical protein
MNASAFYGICPVCRNVGREIFRHGVAWSVCDEHQLKWWTEIQGAPPLIADVIHGIGKGGLLCIEQDSPIADLASLNSYREVDLTLPANEKEAEEIDERCGWFTDYSLNFFP